YLFPQVGQVTRSTGIVELTHGQLISEMLDEADGAVLGQATRPQSRGGVCRADRRRAVRQVAHPVGSVDLS
ncbi:DeoR faimly transcriptional regulator, partial [Xanthomonas vasicola pv. musacearum NCPPB 4384]